MKMAYFLMVIISSVFEYIALVFWDFQFVFIFGLVGMTNALIFFDSVENEKARKTK